MAPLNNLALAVTNAVAFLTRPLAAAYPVSTIAKLRTILGQNLEAFYAPTWDVTDPLRHSGRRCLSLSPSCLPPRVIYSACVTADVQWFDWITLLGGREFDLLADPGCVSVRFGKKGTKEFHVVTVWADEIPSPTYACSHPTTMSMKTVAQQLLEADKEEEEQLFAMIDDEIRAPTWLTPIIDQFPMPRPPSRISTISNHSRCSSRSSNSSSGLSFTSASVASSSSTSSNPASKKDHRQSRRERARNSRVFVDKSKNDVTPYDGGKTTVLTGGVMLGAPNKPRATKPATMRAGCN